MKTIEKRDYMQSTIDMQSRTHYDTIASAHAAAIEVYRGEHGDADVLSVGASCIIDDDTKYFRIVFFADPWGGSDNLACAADDDRDLAREYFLNVDKFYDMGDWARSEGGSR